MPKELIYTDAPTFVRDEDGNEYPSSEAPPGSGLTVLDRAVHVGWTRNGFVEVGVNEVEASTATGSTETGMFLSLDRAGCNALIRHLRRARDGAFGADA